MTLISLNHQLHTCVTQAVVARSTCAGYDGPVHCHNSRHRIVHGPLASSAPSNAEQSAFRRSPLAPSIARKISRQARSVSFTAVLSISVLFLNSLKMTSNRTEIDLKGLRMVLACALCYVIRLLLFLHVYLFIYLFIVLLA